MPSLRESGDWLRVTLSSIGDAVITTDALARVTFLNPVAQALTGWTQAEAVGLPVERVFHIINEDSREPVEHPGARVLREGVVVGLANHTLLVGRDGSEWHIDDSAAPIRDEAGTVSGVVLVFRDIGERRRLERQRAAALAYAQAVLATLRGAFLVLDGNLTVVSANAAFYRSFQTTPEATVARRVYDLGNGQWDIPALRTLLEEILPQRNAFEDFEVAHDFPAIGRRILEVNARRIEGVGEDGAPLILMAMEDVTERRRIGAALQDSEVRYRRLFQASKDGILILDAQTGRIEDANAFMIDMLGRGLPELLGKQLFEIGVFSDIAANKAAFEELQHSGYIRYEHLPVQKPDGTLTHVEFISNVYREGERLVAQCNVRDISDRIELEGRIRHQAEEMADQLRRKDEFLAMLSHELRNPLAPIVSATHLLRLQERGNENPIVKQAREVIERQVGNLTKLISDLLEISRVISGRVRLDLELVDLSQIVRHALETTGPLVARQKHVLTLSLPDEPVLVSADPGRLEQVVVNLLTNAAKFTTEGGRIDVGVRCEREQAVLSVRDTGVGISAAMLPHLFDLFSQADRSLDRAQGGLGIGLCLVDRLVKLHGGAVEARSEGPGCGSEFVVRMPLAPPPGAQPIQLSEPARLAAPVGARSLRVLVVDDNVDACMMLAHVVRQHGDGVKVAFTGPAALEVAQAWRPDVVLLDLGLPQLDGYEVARRLRDDSGLQGVKLVAVTGYANEADLRLGREAGFHAHLEKPVDPARIEALLVGWRDVVKAAG